MPRAPFAFVCAAAVATAAFAVLGCTPAVGDRCTLSTDCSIQGTRVCDTSQPNGYCTLFACTPNSCPDNAACVELNASVPGCPYDDYGAPSRSGRAMCLKTCGSDSDCRQGEGYVCADPRQSPWTAILDTNQSEHVCMVSGATASFVDAGIPQVCSADRPDASPLDVTVPVEDSSEGSLDAEEAAADVGLEAADTGQRATDASQEAADTGQEAADAGQDTGEEDGGDDGDAADATADAVADTSGDAQVDGTVDAIADSGAVDAPDGG
jgi:hypothetical protein